MIRTVNSKTRCMLIDTKLPMRFWAEAVRTAPKLDHLRRFGCTAYKYIPKDQRGDKKFGERSRPCMMLGEDQNGFQTKNQMEEYDIQFPEESDDERTAQRTPNALIVEKANRGGNDDINPISLLNEPDPISLEEAMVSPHRSLWIDAMKDEQSEMAYPRMQT
jgi:hypothetical protein